MVLYGLKIPDERWTVKDQTFLSWVSVQRQEKCQRYHLDIDRKLCLYSVLLLKMKISQNWGFPKEELRFSVTDYGKPVLRSQKKIFFNLSHSGAFVLCGMDTEGELGVDIQKAEEPPYEIMESCFHPAEHEYTEKAEGEIRKKRFYKIWTRKEAYFKSIGTGLINDMQNLNTLQPSIQSCFYTWDLPDYVYSVFSKKRGFVQMKEVTLECLQEYYMKY